MLAAMTACVLGLPSARSEATNEGCLLLLWSLLVNSIVFSFSAVIGCFCSSLAATADKNRRNGEKDRTEDSGGWQGASGGAASAKRALLFGAKPALPKRPSEPRSGVHLRSQKWGEDARMQCIREPVVNDFGRKL